MWHWYLSSHLYDCYWVLFMGWLLSFIYVMFIVSMWGLISSICETAIDKTLGWIIFLFRINIVVVVVHNMYYVISWFLSKNAYAVLFQLFLPHYQWNLLCKTYLENPNYNIFCKNATRKIFFQVKNIALYILINS